MADISWLFLCFVFPSVLKRDIYPNGWIMEISRDPFIYGVLGGNLLDGNEFAIGFSTLGVTSYLQLVNTMGQSVNELNRLRERKTTGSLPEKVIRYVCGLDNEKLQNLTEDQLADRFKVNVFELSRKFKDYTRYLLSDYLHFARLLYTLRRKEGDLPLMKELKSSPFEAVYTIDMKGQILIKRYIRFNPFFCDEAFIAAEIVPHVIGGDVGASKVGKNFSVGVQFFDHWAVFKIVISAVEDSWIQFSVKKA